MKMTKLFEVLFDGSVFRPAGPSISKREEVYHHGASPEDPDADKDPAFEIASLAVDTHIPDLAEEHDHYLYGSPKRTVHGGTGDL